MSSGDKLAKGKSKKAAPKAKTAKGKEVPVNDHRFRGEGVKFKCKLVGSTDVSSARGDAMCADAIKKLKVHAMKLNKESGEHKQKIVLNITLKGIRITDEKTLKLQYDHPINKISFITHDPEDKKVFGYVYSQPCSTGHKLFAIKTEKSAGAVTETLFGLFQVVFQLRGKKKQKTENTHIYSTQKSNVREQAALTKETPNSAQVSNAPPEILARGSLALRAYDNALREGKTCVKRVPVMLIGQDRSGKTSLKKSLRGLVFNPDEDSTVGIDVDPSYFEVSTEVWKAGEKDQQSSVAAISYEHHAAQLIVGRLMGEKQPLEERAIEPILSESVALGSSTLGHSSASSDTQGSDERGLEPVQSRSSLLAGRNLLKSYPALPSKFPRTSNVRYPACKPPDADRDDVPNLSELHEDDASIVPEEIATLVERLLHKVNTVDDDKDVYSVLWDFGGQSVYYVTHPLFLTSRAIYLLVYDLSRNPYDKADPLVRQGMFRKIEDNFSLKTNLDYLDFWMTSVASLASQRRQQPVISNSVVIPAALPPVFLVCTHSDEPYSGEDPCAVANEIFHFLQNKPYSAHLFEHVFVVDNTKSGGKSECPEVSRLRQNVLAVAKDLPQMTEAIPIKWLQFEKALRVMKEEGHEWITLERSKQIASKVCKIDDDHEVVTLLNYLHDQRILIHFDNTPELNKLVVLDPQWLIDVFKKVITVKPYDQEERKFKVLWKKLEETGIMEETLLEHVWGALLEQEETCDSLIAIMEKFSLMCLWPSSHASCGKQYLVPSMLMSYPSQGIMKLLEAAQIPSLFLKFACLQIPPDLFPRLVLQFFQWCTDEFPGVADPQLHHNFARFYISEYVGCSVVLLCHPSSIEVIFLNENYALDLHSQSNLKLADKRLTAVRAVRRQLVLLLDCMKKEFCWFNNIRCEACFLCPACSRGGSVTYCQTHRAQGCSQQECLHFWLESDLCNAPETVICRKSADAMETRVQVKQFAPWFILPNKKVNIRFLKVRQLTN